jgi:hypothetical protein
MANSRRRTTDVEAALAHAIYTNVQTLEFFQNMPPRATFWNTRHDLLVAQLYSQIVLI